MTATREHRVVLELSSGDPEVWAGALRNAENVRDALGAERTQVALVAHGKGIGLYLSDRSALRDQLGALHAAGVELDACAKTLARLGVDRSRLPPGVTVVDSGVATVVRKQEEGWSYVKTG